MEAGGRKVKQSYKIDNLFLNEPLFIVKYFSRVPPTGEKNAPGDRMIHLGTAGRFAAELSGAFPAQAAPIYFFALSGRNLSAPLFVYRIRRSGFSPGTPGCAAPGPML